MTTGSGRISAGGAAANLQFSDFSATATLSPNSNTAGVFAFGTWVAGGATDQSDTFTGAPDPTEYYEFSISPDPGFRYTLTGLSFSAGRTSTGPRQFVIRSDADAYAANLPAAAASPLSVVAADVFQLTDNTTTNLVAGQSVTFSGASYTDLTEPVTFRLYAFNAEGSGTFRIDDLAISGTVSAVPEPAASAVLVSVCSLAGSLLFRRRRPR